jgi:hypothetical protein
MLRKYRFDIALISAWLVVLALVYPHLPKGPDTPSTCYASR